MAHHVSVLGAWPSDQYHRRMGWQAVGRQRQGADQRVACRGLKPDFLCHIVCVGGRLKMGGRVTGYFRTSLENRKAHDQDEYLCKNPFPHRASLLSDGRPVALKNALLSTVLIWRIPISTQDYFHYSTWKSVLGQPRINMLKKLVAEYIIIIEKLAQRSKRLINCQHLNM